MTVQIQPNSPSLNTKTTGGERRRESRVDLKLRVRYPRRNAFFFEYTRNISRGGMFIATRTPFEPGTFLTFELQIPEEPELLKIRGEVRWRVLPSDVASCKKNISELECGMGIAFVFDSPQDRLAFENQVIGMLEEELGTQAARRLIEQSRWPE